MKKRNLVLGLLMSWVVAVHAEDIKVSLNGKWNLQYWPQPAEAIRSPSDIAGANVSSIDAVVPGNVEIDLERAGVIDNPMIGDNVYKLRKYEGYQWCYTRKFAAPADIGSKKVKLSFAGVDCFADYWLNGRKIGESSNMLIEHDFDVTKLLDKTGENELKVILRSAVIESSKYRIGTVGIRKDGNSESEYVRKAPHSYGWDILPRLISAGIWRNVELQVIDEVSFDNVYWYTRSIDKKHKKAEFTVDYQLNMPFELFDKVYAEVTLSKDGKIAYQAEHPIVSYVGRHMGTVNDAEFWWPLGYGESPLYDAAIRIMDENGKIYATDFKRIGLRTIHLDHTEITTPERHGRFDFVVNGEKVFVKGTNWVPVDALHSRDAERIGEVLDMLKDVNCNMVRCWGGNVYEDHAFYDFCDANGIMVWQDFSMGCTMYPQRLDFLEMIDEEITSVVVKLRNHTSIALWAGNNENDVALEWQGLHKFGVNPNKDLISRTVIPKVLWEFDPVRDYLASSPYLGDHIFTEYKGDSNFAPEQHLWGPRGYYKASFYSDNTACFASEIGYHGCPNMESLKKMFTKDCVYPWVKGLEWNHEWLTKSVRCMAASKTTEGRNNLMTNQIKYLFGEVPSKLESFITASQIVQGEAKKYFIEMFRGSKGQRSGILWWNLRDGWPVVSDAVVDYYNSKKLAYDYIKNAQANTCVLINDAVNGSFPISVVNDTRVKHSGKVTVRDVADNKVVYQGLFDITPNFRQVIGTIPDNGKQGVFLIEYEVDGNELHNHYLYGKAPFKLNDYVTWMKKAGLFSRFKQLR